MAEEFTFTPIEVRPLARQIAAHLEAQRFKVRFEEPLSKQVGYSTTLLASKGALRVLVEVQHRPEYHQALHDFVLFLRAQRTFTELYLAISEEAELSAKTLGALKEDGIGILFVENERISVHQNALNPALTVTVHPDLKFGHYKEKVMAAINTFNSSNPKHGFQEMCEIVEDGTRKLLIKAISKGWMTADIRAAEGDWSHCINLLASAARYTGGKQPLFREPLKNDLHSFRGARNLVDHPTKNRYEKQKLIRQYVERMAMGSRLVADLITISRRIT